jgi:hypothetical protein
MGIPIAANTSGLVVWGGPGICLFPFPKNFRWSRQYVVSRTAQTAQPTLVPAAPLGFIDTTFSFPSIPPAMPIPP